MNAETLTSLWALQRLDSELDTITAKIADNPRKIEAIKLAAANEKKQLDDARQTIADLKKRYKLTEIEVKETDEKVGVRSAQLYGAKTNEMYKAFLREIEGLNAQKNKLEESMIVAMEQTEHAERRLHDLEKECASLEADTRSRVQTLEQELVELKAALDARQADRAGLVSNMEPDVVKRYERIRTSKKGIAVVGIAGDRCNGCMFPIPPQLMLEVDKRDRLHACEHCGRILVPAGVAQYDKG